MKVEFLKSVYNIEDYKNLNLPEIAFSGRSNVGKSSLINTLFNYKIAHTSKKPGKTKCINFFKVEDRFLVVDLPGYGYAAVSKKMQNDWKDLIEAYIARSRCLRRVFILVEAKRGLEFEEMQLMEWLDHLKRPFTLVFTKIDKIGKNELAVVKKHYSEYNPLFFSAVTKEGRKELITILKGEQCF
ncbi:MAG: ribosome biogenesis GTP-binding protein YihA/YsxC [bacterium]